MEKAEQFLRVSTNFVTVSKSTLRLEWPVNDVRSDICRGKEEES